MDMKTKITMGVMIGVFTLLAIGGVFAANETPSQAYGPGYGRGYNAENAAQGGYGPRDGFGQTYGRGQMMRGFAANNAGNGTGFAGCPMTAALQEQGVSAEEIAQWHQELIESGKMGPGAMRALLESKGVDTSDFPAVGWRRAQQ